MEPSTSAVSPLSEEWCAQHFDYREHELGQNLTSTLRTMRQGCPVAHSDVHGGYWVVTRYEDVLKVAQDWQTFSSALGISIPATEMVLPAIPEHLDPPEHRIYKRLINPYFTPAAVAPYEEPTRAIVTRLIDGFIESGTCDFQTAFARPFPGLAFFELALGAPPDEAERVNALSTAAQDFSNPGAKKLWGELVQWIKDFAQQRRSQPPRGDVVDAVLSADIDGRPITDEEVWGVIQLLILGGLDTTSGALGQFMIRFAEQPEIPALLRSQPELIPQAVEELLRLDSPFAGVGRTAAKDAELGGRTIKQGEKVMIYWASANHDDDEFADADDFDVARRSNRHLTFGAGPHRCAGSNLARLNLRIAVEELTARLVDIEIPAEAKPIEFHSIFSRAPLSVPITFAPGPPIGEAR
jgi:cytochrome P450